MTDSRFRRTLVGLKQQVADQFMPEGEGFRRTLVGLKRRLWCMVTHHQCQLEDMVVDLDENVTRTPCAFCGTVVEHEFEIREETWHV